MKRTFILSKNKNMTETGFDLVGDGTNLNDVNNAPTNQDGQVMIGDLNNQDPSLNYQSSENINNIEGTNSEFQGSDNTQQYVEIGTVGFPENQEPQENLTTDNYMNELNSNIEFNSDNDLSSYSDSTIDQSIFLDSSNDDPINQVDEHENYGNYLRTFFISSFLIIIGVACIALEYSFKYYIQEAEPIGNQSDSYVKTYKEYFKKAKSLFGINSDNVKTPNTNEQSYENFNKGINDVISTGSLDYIEKRDLLIPTVSTLNSEISNKVDEINKIRKETAIQGFLPDEIKNLLNEEGGIDTIQRSLNALEIIKFSTAAKVFSYMNTALETLTYMVGRNGVNRNTIYNLLTQITSRGEKDISSYVYLCYLNPYETDSNCNAIGDLDLYYKLNNQSDVFNLDTFKRTLSAINQLLENEDSAMFTITFNGFNATSKNITFNIEVFTNQSDEKALISQGKRNPNIFILTSIINLLKQSSFIIGANINTKEINVETQEVTIGGLKTTVNYSTKTFELPIQKSSEREIFDYIDLTNISNILNKAEKSNEEEYKEDSLKDSLENSLNDSIE